MRSAAWQRTALVLVALVNGTMAAVAQRPASCGGNDSAAAVIIRQRILDWVSQTNRKDFKSAGTIWAPGVVGWFPRGPEFSDSAALAAAGGSAPSGPPRVTYEVRIEQIDVAGSIAAVHDVWHEQRSFPGAQHVVQREIRGSELWRCEADGTWRISRWVSAPEHWVARP